MTSTTMVDIFLEDINDHSPDIQYNKNKFCLGSEKPVIINAVDKDVPPNTGPYTFSMDPRFSKHWKLRSIGMETSYISQLYMIFSHTNLLMP